MMQLLRWPRIERKFFLVTWGSIIFLSSSLAIGGDLPVPDGPRVGQPELERPTRVRELPGQPAGRLFPAISRDGTRVAAGGDAGILTVWDAENGRVLRIFDRYRAEARKDEEHKNDGHEAQIIAVALSPDGRQVASSGPARVIMVRDEMSMGGYPDGAIIKLWDVGTGRLVHSLDPGSVADAVGFSDAGDTLVAVILGYDLRTWNVKTGLPTFKLIKSRWSVRYYYEQLPRQTAFSDDGRRVAALPYGSGDTKLFDLTTGRTSIVAYDKRTRTPVAVALSGDGKRLAIVSADHTLSVWDFDTGKLLRLVPSPQPQDPLGRPVVLAFDSKGHRIASGGMDGVVRIWDDDGSDHPSRTIAGPASPVRAIACPQTDFRVVSGGCVLPGIHVGIPKSSPLTVWDAGAGPRP